MCLILSWLMQSQHHQSITVQHGFIGKLISEYCKSKEVGYTLAVQPNYVYYNTADVAEWLDQRLK
jgi:hypothetical protein